MSIDGEDVELLKLLLAAVHTGDDGVLRNQIGINETMGNELVSRYAI